MFIPSHLNTFSLDSPPDLIIISWTCHQVMLKATAGGGGMGLQICQTPSQIPSSFQAVYDRSKTLFHDPGMFVEKYILESRHVEVQVFGNGMGGAVHFGERECSIQRRHQKVVEECPSPFVHTRSGERLGSWDESREASLLTRYYRWDLGLRKRLTDCAVSLAKSVSYGSAGTVE
jgi:urea carboxylase